MSGGNLQKFIVGREILQAPRLFVCAQPTWGVDVGAAAQIRAALSQVPCHQTDYTIGTYADFVRYDEAHDSVCLRLESGADVALLGSSSPATETAAAVEAAGRRSGSA